MKKPRAPFNSGLVILFALASACSSEGGVTRDASTEAPKVLTPGTYRISIGAAMSGVVQPGSPGSVKTNDICVASTDEDQWMHEVMLSALSTSNECSSEDAKRTGNAISGRAVCPVEPQKGGGEIALEYTGTVSDGKAAFSGTMKYPDMSDRLTGMSDEQKAEMEAGMKAMQAVPINVSMERIGDC